MMAKKFMLNGIMLGFVLAAAAEAVAKSDRQNGQSVHRPLSLYLTHGYSHINNHQLSRLSVGTDAFVIGAGANYHLPSGFGIDTEFTTLNTSRKDSSDYGNSYISQATTSYRQERLAIGGSFRYFLGRNFALFPELGLSYNRVEVSLSEFTFDLEESVGAGGLYLGIGAVVPIKRVFFDFRAKYSVVDLTMDKLGVDSLLYQTTLLVGFGFVI